MKLELSAIVLDHNPQMGEELLGVLGPELVFLDNDFATTNSEVLQHFMGETFDMCFIAEDHPKDKVALLVRDLRKVEKSKDCVFAQVRTNLEDYFDKAALKKLGFSTFISREGTDDDKRNLWKVLHEQIRKRKVLEHSKEVEKVVQKMLLSELGRGVEDCRRGFQRPFNLTARDYILKQFTFDEEVKQNYFDFLAAQTENSKPVSRVELEVPDEILERDLPNLSKNVYSGVSRRVWERLAKKHGKKVSSDSDSASEDTQQDEAAE